jgi:tetratricopeptide (TPR) repeat protein
MGCRGGAPVVLRLLIPLWALMAAAFLPERGSAAAQPACAAAAAIVESRYPDDAKTRWTTLISGCSEKNAAATLSTVQGVAQALADAELERAATSKATGDLQGEISHLSSAHVLEPENAEANSRLTAAYAEYSNQVTHRMAADAKFGHFSEALTAAQELSERRPDQDPRAIIAGSVGGTSRFWLSVAYYRGWILGWGEFVGEVLAAAIVAIALYRRYARPLLVLRDMDNNSAAPGIEQAIQTQLIAASGGGNLGGGSIASGAAKQISRPLETVAPPVDVTTSLPIAFSWTRVIPAVFELLVPRRTYPIRGAVLKDDVHGAGLSLTVEYRGRSCGQIFWADDFGLPTQAEAAASYYALAEYAAVWLLLGQPESSINLLGTGKWRAYASFRAGVHADKRGQADVAKRFYLAALREDDNLQAAHLNVALLAKDDASRLLVQDMLKCAAGRAADTEATRYHARYVLAVREYDLKNERAALEYTLELLADIVRASDAYGFDVPPALEAIVASERPALARKASWQRWLSSLWRRMRPKREAHQELGEFLKFLSPVASAMWTGLEVAVHGPNHTVFSTLAQLGRDQSAAMVLYNLACTCALLVTKSADPGQRRLFAIRGLDYLERSLWLDPKSGTKAPRDMSLTGLRGDTPIADDPSGKVLTARVRFSQLIDQYLCADADADAAGGPLARFDVIGGTSAKSLAKKNIRTPYELITSCAHASQRLLLASDLAVAEERVWQWAATAELTLVLDDLPVTAANLLNQAGIHSLAQLAACNPHSLQPRLVDWSRGTSTAPPSLPRVHEWVTKARSLKSLLDA